jgi:tetratricopeptide (TPR) repeat protein
MKTGRRFAWRLTALLATAGFLRALLLWEFWSRNPFALLPYSDGELYWNRAGEMAAGQWLEPTPFLIAPLYPYLLGTLRTLGGGLPTLYALQTLMHLATAGLVGDATRRRFGESVGLLAAGLFLLLAEPALFANRVLASTLQLLLVALFWWDTTRTSLADAPGRLATLRNGLWLGLLALSFPAALLLVPLHALWLGWRAPTRRAALTLAAAAAGGALLAIAPATLHNAVRFGELIPITAHAGVTLAQGNHPTSVGIYTPLPDVGTSIHDQHRDAARVFEGEQGRPGSWGEVDGHFRRRVLAWWLAHPLDAVALFAQKLRWTASSIRYDNVAVFALEREHGLDRAAWLTPLPLPWLLGLAALGVALARRETGRGLPELALAVLPLLVCVVFYYSARYRVVAAPPLCALAALGVLRARRLAWRPGLVAATALAPAALLAWNTASGFESLDFMREPFARTLARQHVRAGDLRRASGQAERAERHYRAAVLAAAEPEAALQRLYNLQVDRGDYRGALQSLEALVAAAPDDVPARLALAWLLASSPDASLRRGDDARRHALEALRRSGEHPEALLVLALAEAERGRFDAALEAARRARTSAAHAGDDDLVAQLAGLEHHLADERAVRSRPRLLRVATR